MRSLSSSWAREGGLALGLLAAVGVAACSKSEEKKPAPSAAAASATAPLATAPPVKLAPPRVVSTEPALGQAEVDPALAEVSVTFDQDMGQGVSWSGKENETFPGVPEGSKASWRGPRTCVYPVKLEEGRFYLLEINQGEHQGFRSVGGVPAGATPIWFATRGASEEIKARLARPIIVKTTPPEGAQDVDPATAELAIEFSVPMGTAMSWMGGGERFPQMPEGSAPRWSEDRKTLIRPAKLKPESDYALGLNSAFFSSFRSEWGVPLEPTEYSFRTGK